MTDKVKIACSVSAPAAGLTIVAKMDDHVFWQGDPVGRHDLTVELIEDDAAHRLTFELLGKTSAHTQLDQAGNIVQDLLVSIENITLDEIDVQQLFSDHAVYSHDFNGTGPATKGKFFNTMGCNGTITFEFSTPVYLWLLENM